MAGTAWWILHVDLDQFIAAVEVLRHPELAGMPVVVGGEGDPTRRAVVATASYEARAFGVHSGMPLRTAARRCPDAVFLASDPTAYEAKSDEVMAVLRTFPGVVEVLGWDEAFVGTHTDDPESLAGEIRDAVAQRTGLSCAVGIGDNKLRAKLATGFAKPAGVFRLTKDNWVAVMADRPTDALWGIGRKTARKLDELGLTTVRGLAVADPAELAARFGPRLGPWYRQLALGASSTEVEATPYEHRSRSRETTFQEDLTDWSDIAEQVGLLAAKVAEDVTTEGRPAARIGVKVRYAPFITQTRSVTLDSSTDDVEVIRTVALELLRRFDRDRPVRLLGVRAEFSQD